MKRTATLVILLAFTIILLGIAVALQGRTLVEWWKPAAICLIPAIIVGAAAGNALRRLTRWSRRWLNAAAMSVISFSVLLGAFYALNYYKTDNSGAGTFDAVVAQKYTQERYDTKRVGRRTVRGQKRTVYNVVITLPDESTKKISVTPGQYARTRIGQKFAIQIENGFFGLPVIKHIGFPDGKKHVRKRKQSIQ